MIFVGLPSYLKVLRIYRANCYFSTSKRSDWCFANGNPFSLFTVAITYKVFCKTWHWFTSFCRGSFSTEPSEERYNFCLSLGGFVSSSFDFISLFYLLRLIFKKCTTERFTSLLNIATKSFELCLICITHNKSIWIHSSIENEKSRRQQTFHKVNWCLRLLGSRGENLSYSKIYLLIIILHYFCHKDLDKMCDKRIGLNSL